MRCLKKLIFYLHIKTMEDGNLAVIVDAKVEYTKQLVSVLKGNMYQGIKRIYTECKEDCVSRNELASVLTQLQKKLEEVPKWNQEVILAECENILTESKCDWLDELITAVFVSHTRILSSINFSKNKRQINLKIPKVDHFIHQCYIDIARIFYKNPYLLDDTISRYEYQKNRNESETLIEKSIENTIRKQLPVKHILQEYLSNDYSNQEEEVKTENEPEPEVTAEELEAEVVEPSPESVVEPVVESVVESVVEPVVESVVEPVVESEALPTVEPESEPEPKLSDLNMNIRDLVRTEIENTAREQEKKNVESEAVVESLAESLEEQSTEPVAEPVNEPVAEVTEGEKSVSFAETTDFSNENISLNLDEKKEELEEEPKIEFDVSDTEDLDLDLDLDLDVKTIDLGPIEEPFASNDTEGSKEEVKTILLDTKNSLSEEDLEKKQKLKEKKSSFNFFSDSIENDNLELE